MRVFKSISRSLLKDTSGKVALTFIITWVGVSIISRFTDIVHFSANGIDKLNANYKPPGVRNSDGYIHFMGTDGIGRDIAAGVIHGSSYAFTLCMITLVISLSIGLLLGMTAGFYGNKGLRLNIIQQLISLFGIFVLTYMFVYGMLTLIGSVIIVLLLYGMILLCGRVRMKRYPIYLDAWIMKLFEIKESMPALMIILFVVGYVGSMNVVTLSVLISLFYSLTYARYIRNETMAIRDEDYIAAARSTGLSTFSIMKSHIFPNILPYIMVVIVFSMSGVILLESTLSFLGLGVGVETVTWGKILAQSRMKPSAWWLAIFPGMAIFLVIWSFNIIGEKLSLSLKVD